MMKVHREQVRQRYHQNVQSKSNKMMLIVNRTNMMKEKKNPVKKVWK